MRLATGSTPYDPSQAFDGNTGEEGGGDKAEGAGIVWRVLGF